MRKCKHGYSSPSLRCTTLEGKTYAAWAAMIQRCTNPNCKSWKNYGGRSINVCQRWLDFRNFITDMGIRPKGLSIERIDNARSYEPENVIWATRTQNARNQRNTRLIRVNGVTCCMREWAHISGIKESTISSRINASHWDPAKAVTTPLIQGQKQHRN